MPVAIITGAGGLIGSEAVEHFIGRGLRRRRDRERHAGQLLRPRVLDRARHRAPGRRARRASTGRTLDIRDADGDRADLRRARRLDRAGRPHRRPALPRLGRPRAADRLRRQRQRHPQPARGRPRPLPRRARSSSARPTRSTATRPTACRCEDAGDSGWSCPRHHPYYKGIDTSMSIDLSTHSLFGASKAAADLLVQEYGRYFEMPTVVLPRRLPDRPPARRRQAARLPRLPDEVHRHRHALHRLRLRRQAGARQHPQRRPGRRLRRVPQGAPRRRAVYNIGGGRFSNCSMLEAIDVCERIAGRELELGDGRGAADRRPPLVDLRPGPVRGRLPGLVSCATGSRRSCSEMYEQNLERWTANAA